MCRGHRTVIRSWFCPPRDPAEVVMLVWKAPLTTMSSPRPLVVFSRPAWDAMPETFTNHHGREVLIKGRWTSSAVVIFIWNQVSNSYYKCRVTKSTQENFLWFATEEEEDPSEGYKNSLRMRGECWGIIFSLCLSWIYSKKQDHWNKYNWFLLELTCQSFLKWCFDFKQTTEFL